MFGESPRASNWPRRWPGVVLIACAIAGCDPSTAAPRTVDNPAPEKSKLAQKKKHLQDLQSKPGPGPGTP